MSIRRMIPLALAAVLAAGLAATAHADVCARSDAGMTCAGPGGGRTTVTAQSGCCVFVDSIGAVALGRTGIVGTGVGGRSATLTLYGNGYQAGRTDVEPDKVVLHVQVDQQTVDARAHAGCCIEGSAQGPVAVGRTGVHGDERLAVWVNGEREASCLTERLPRCRLDRLN